MKDALVEFRRYRGRLEATSAILYIISCAELHAAMLASHARYDLLLTPTMPVTALKVGLVVPDDGAFGDDWLNWSPYTYPFNLTQQPRLASGGAGVQRPDMGAQIVGRSPADALVLRAGRTIERALPMPAVAGHT